MRGIFPWRGLRRFAAPLQGTRISLCCIPRAALRFALGYYLCLPPGVRSFIFTCCSSPLFRMHKQIIHLWMLLVAAVQDARMTVQFCWRQELL